MSEWACDRIEELEAECDLLRKIVEAGERAFDAMEKMHDDLGVQLRFWRQAAEHAVNGWNALEDKYEQLVEAARGVIEKSGAERAEAWQALETFTDDREEWAPLAEATPDPAPGLHIVEEENPR